MEKKRLLLYWMLQECFVSLAIAAMYMTNGNLSQFYCAENGAEYHMKQYILLSVGCFFLLSIFSFLVQKQIKKLCLRVRSIGEKIWSFFESMIDIILEHIKKPRISAQYTTTIRSILIAFILGVGYLAHMAGARKYYGYTVIFMLAFFYMLTVWTLPERKCEYKLNGVKIAWFSLCLLQILSDFVIQKKTGFLGLWMLASFGIFYRAWERIEEPEKIWNDFARAVEILYLLTIGYCLFIEPWWNKKEFFYVSEFLYPGMWKNPNPFSIMLVLFVLVMLYRIFQIFSKKQRYWKITFYLAGLLFACRLILLTQCRTAILSCIVLFVWACLFALGRRIKNIKISPSRVFAILMVVFLIIAAVFAVKGGALFSKKGAASTLDEMTSGRLTIWQGYLMQMNLWGHEGDALVGGVSAYAHNVFLKMMHTYGIFAGILIFVLLIEVFRRAFLYWECERKNETSFLVMGILLTYVISAMIESVDDLPMVWQIWSSFYFAVGFLMIQDGKQGCQND